MTTRRWLGAVVTAGVVTSGCLQREVRETWRLQPDGGVMWSVLESEVRSDAQAVVDRQNEETAFLLAVQREDHPIARAFRELHFANVKTRLLEAVAPFTVFTGANAGRIDGLGQRLISAFWLQGTSVLTREGDTWQWTFSVRDPHAANVDAPVSDDLTSLMGGLSELRVVLSSGRFDEAQGFTLSGDRRIATFKDPDESSSTEATLVLRLKWTQ
jgi:hypothetical protein